MSEWYSNGPLGIEQGFTIPRPPAHGGTGPLTLSLALSGNLRASLEHGGQQLDLDRAGRPALAYRDLTASDASGRTLTARLAPPREAPEAAAPEDQGHDHVHSVALIGRPGRLAPRCVFALPLRLGMCSTSPVSGRTATIG